MQSSAGDAAASDLHSYSFCCDCSSRPPPIPFVSLAVLFIMAVFSSSSSSSAASLVCLLLQILPLRLSSGVAITDDVVDVEFDAVFGDDDSDEVFVVYVS